MMSRRTDRSETRRLRARRAIATGLAALALAIAPAVSAEPQNVDASGRVNPAVDVMLLRPMGILATLTGTAMFVVATPIILITRPMEFAGPLDYLVLRPARYTWRDPIGDHGSPAD
jgi:hypothetical protein